MKIYKNPFEVEKLRAELAKNSNYKELSDTYSSRLPEIANINSSDLWDKLNTREELLQEKNLMEKDKLKWVKNKIKANKSRVLNIGFGSGNLEEILLKRKEEHFLWYGIDVSPESVENVSSKFKNSTFVVGDVRELNFKNNSFDYIIALEVLEHISPRDILSVLKDIRYKLKKGGFFILSVPLNEGLELMIKKGKNPNAHVRIYTPELIMSELKISGFEIVEHKLIYAFRSFYNLKTFLIRYILKDFRQSNGIIIIAKKK